MNSQINKIALVLSVSALFLVGCEEKESYRYLMQHPLVAQKKSEDCRRAETQSPEDVERCKIIFSAVDNINSMLADQQADAEKFGQRIIDMQSEVMLLQQRISAAKNTLHSMKASSADIQKAKTELDQLQITYHDKSDQLAVLLAVVGMGSPE